MIPYATSNDIARCKTCHRTSIKKNNSIVVDSKELDKIDN